MGVAQFSFEHITPDEVHPQNQFGFGVPDRGFTEFIH
jgi:hypothetical protein